MQGGRKPKGSRAAMSLRGDITVSEYAPLSLSMAAQTAGAEDAGGAAAEEGTQFSAFAAPEEREAEPPEQSVENALGTSEKHGEEN